MACVGCIQDIHLSVNIDGGFEEGNKIAGYRKQLDKIGFSFDWAEK
jgi:leucyl-tRNA synthetase